MKRLNDAQLLDDIQADSRLAFEELVRRYADTLFRFIYKRIQNKEEAEDILQEVFISFWNRRNHIHIEGSLYPYLFQACKYEVIDHMVNKDKQLARLSSLLDAVPTNFSVSTEEEYMAKELNQLIEEEVDNMPKTMRKAFTMSRNQSMSIREIASKLALSEQTVKNNISLAISKLKLKFK